MGHQRTVRPSRSPITDQFRQQAELAWAYAEDGAFHSAARALGELAARVKDHAVMCDGMYEEAALDSMKRAK